MTDPATAVADTSDRRRTEASTVLIAVLAAAVLVLVGGSIGLWATLDNVKPGSSGREALLLGLFAVAGALGGVLRSFSYLLAYGSFSARERQQWRREALTGPFLGAVAGFGAFLAIDGLLVGEGDPNRAGQYLVSLAAGAIAVTQAGKIVERGILRGSLNRSGILGGETSPAVPLLQRLEQTLEQRLADLTVVNFDGYVVARAMPLDASRWMLEVVFDSREPVDEQDVSVGRVKIGGGVDQDYVNFNLSVVSDTVSASPLVLTVTAPRHEKSEQARFVLESAHTDGAAMGRRAAILEIGQGSQVIQVMPLSLQPQPPAAKVVR